MKTSKKQSALIVSIAANFILAIGLIYDPVPSVSTTLSALPDAPPKTRASSPEHLHPDQECAKGVANRLLYGTNSSLRDRFNALENVGLPAALIKQVLLAELTHQHSDRTDQKRGTGSPLAQAVNRQDHVTRDLATKAKARAQLLRLYGDAAIDDPVFADLFKPYYGELDFLSSDTQIALFELQAHHDAERYDAQQSGARLSEDQKAAQRDLYAAIEDLLLPDELAQYQLQHSEMAQNIRDQTNGFFHSEAEFEEVVAIALEYDIPWVAANAPYPDDVEVNLEERDARIRDFLGEDRFQEYTRLQDSNYHSLTAELSEQYSKKDIARVFDLVTELKMVQKGGQRNPLEIKNQQAELESILGLEGVKKLSEVEFKIKIPPNAHWHPL
ncbi:MAG: hypothetical protein V3T17_09990 [Pseudomonadales bacterium]